MNMENNILKPCLAAIPGLPEAYDDLLRRARAIQAQGVKRGYLGGPMRGYEEYNFPTFDLVAAHLRELGFEIVSPAEKDRSDGFDPSSDAAQPLIHYMRKDLPMVLHTDAIFLLPNWEESVGAELETVVARACELPAIDALTLDLLEDDAVASLNCPHCEEPLDLGSLIAGAAAEVVGTEHPHILPTSASLSILRQISGAARKRSQGKS
jgi:hypothetical protein